MDNYDLRPQILKPYKQTRRFKWLPIIIISEDHKSYWREDTETIGTNFRDLLSAPKSIIVVDSSADWARTTSKLHKVHDAFDYGLTVFETSLIDVPDYIMEREVCFEWGLRPKLRTDSKKNNDNTNWHNVLDPEMFIGMSNLGLLSDDDDLYRFASEYREWCQSRNIPISLSKGSAAGRILRGLVKESQVKVPYATNQNCRHALGANLTITNTHGRTHIDVTEFDQYSAQHLVAHGLALPDRNSFIAHGDFNRQEQVFFYPGTEWFNRLTQQQERGVILCEVEQWEEKIYRARYPYSPYRPFTDEPIWITTNELSLVKRCGIIITGIIAAWTSPDRSYELTEHAKLALEELEHAEPFTKSWLKPINLAVYGSTAATARVSLRRTLRLGDSLPRRQNERITNHVTWLAMIQREVRKRSVMFALDLLDQDIKVIGIYVDAVYAQIGNHDIEKFIPAYFLEKAKGSYDGHGSVRIFGDRVVFPGVPLSDPDRESQAREYIREKSLANI